MQWITENWLALALIGGMLAMHRFGHGKHGAKGGGGCCGGSQKQEAAKESAQSPLPEESRNETV